jgi:hypothetical protein
MTRTALAKGALIGGIIPGKEIQNILKSTGFYTGAVDDHVGDQTIKAVVALLDTTRYAVANGWTGWDTPRLMVAAGQVLCHTVGIDAGKVDGLVGPQTTFAFNEFVSTIIKGNKPYVRPALTPVKQPDDDVIASVKNVWPLEKDMLKYYGAMGQNQTKVKVPFDMVLAWDLSDTVETITIHEKCADSLERILARIAGHYSPAEIEDLGINKFGGSLNVRLMRGSKTKWSIHSWGCAIDFDPERNGLNTTFAKARLGKKDAVQFWKFWEEEGWVSLGRSYNYDAMHVQAARR